MGPPKKGLAVVFLLRPVSIAFRRYNLSTTRRMACRGICPSRQPAARVHSGGCTSNLVGKITPWAKLTLAGRTEIIGGTSV
jgi:hypothetical protein